MLYKELYHHGIKGQKWGVRRFQNPDGSLTKAGQKRYNKQGYIETESKKENVRSFYTKKYVDEIDDPYYDDLREFSPFIRGVREIHNDFTAKLTKDQKKALRNKPPEDAYKELIETMEMKEFYKVAKKMKDGFSPDKLFEAYKQNDPSRDNVQAAARVNVFLSEFGDYIQKKEDRERTASAILFGLGYTGVRLLLSDEYSEDAYF